MTFCFSNEVKNCFVSRCFLLCNCRVKCPFLLSDFVCSLVRSNRSTSLVWTAAAMAMTAFMLVFFGAFMMATVPPMLWPMVAKVVYPCFLRKLSAVFKSSFSLSQFALQNSPCDSPFPLKSNRSAVYFSRARALHILGIHSASLLLPNPWQMMTALVVFVVGRWSTPASFSWCLLVKNTFLVNTYRLICLRL